MISVQIRFPPGCPSRVRDRILVILIFPELGTKDVPQMFVEGVKEWLVDLEQDTWTLCLGVFNSRFIKMGERRNYAIILWGSVRCRCLPLMTQKPF